MATDYTPYSGIPIPDKAAARDVPGWLSAIFAVADQRFILLADSSADRDALYTSCEAGVVVVSRTDQTVWVKTSASTTSPATWATVYTPPAAVVWTPITLDAGVIAYGNPPEAAQIGDFVYLRGLAGLSAGAFPTPNTNPLGTLPGTVPLPEVFHSFAVSCSGSGTGRLDVETTGRISFLTTISGLFWASMFPAFYYVG